MLIKNPINNLLLIILLCTVTLSIAADPGDDRYSEEKILTKTVPASPGQRLELEKMQADIQIKGTRGNQIQVKATVRVSHNDREVLKQFLDRTELVLRKTSKGYALSIASPRDSLKSKGGFITRFFRKIFDGGSFRTSMTVDVLIEVPEKQNLTIHNSFGDITISDVEGKLRIKNNSGEVGLLGCRGDLDLKNSFDGVSVINHQGRVNIRNNSGEVTLEQINGETHVNNSFNAIRFDSIEGRLTIRGQSSKVFGQNVNGDCSISTSFNPVILKKTSGSIEIHSSSSPIEVSEIHKLPKDGNVELVTTFNPITLKLPKDAPVTLVPYTKFGKIYSDFPAMMIGKDQSDAEAQRQDGHTLIRLVTDGNIKVRKE